MQGKKQLTLAGDGHLSKAYQAIKATAELLLILSDPYIA